MKHFFLLLAAITALIAPHALAQTYDYDEIGRLKEVRYPSGSGVSYAYDSQDNLISITPYSHVAMPTDLDMVITAFRTAQLNWQHVGGATGFLIQKRFVGAFDWTDLITLGPAARSHVISNPNGELFNLRIIALGLYASLNSAASEEIFFPNDNATFVTTLVDENDAILGTGLGNSLREVIATASPGTVIKFANVLNGGTITLTNGPILISKRLTIDGSALSNKITILASDASRIFTIKSLTPVILKEITLSGGNAALGGAVQNDGSPLTVHRCSFLNNVSPDKGGAIYNFNAGNLTVDDGAIFRTNSAVYGGAIFNEIGATLLVDGCTFTDNSATQDGGAILNLGTAFTVGYSSFSANGAAKGGAICNRDSTGLIVNSTFAQNGSTLDLGGGIGNDGTGALIVRHCTVCANVGFGIANTTPATLTLDNSIIASNFNTSNAAREFLGSYTAVGANLIRLNTGSTSTKLSGPIVITGDPKLGELISGVMAPLIGSPVVDAGVVTPDTPSVDQQRSSRNFAAAPDLGAVESRLNADVDLIWVTLSSGLLSPAFDSTVYQYTAQVPASVSTIAVRAAKVANNQTLETRINGGSFTALASKVASPNYSLATGVNTIELKVTAGNGATTRSYIITVTRGATSPNLGLSSLTPATGTLSPAFDPTVTEYALSVPNANSTTTLTVPAAQPGSTVQVRPNYALWMDVPAGNITPPLPLHSGDNMVEFQIITAEGAITGAYKVVITREFPAMENANLAQLTTSAGALSPAFSPGTIHYFVTVPNTTTTATVTPTKVEPGATIQVNSVPLASGATSAPAELYLGDNAIEVKVIAPNGTTTRIYTVTVNRPGTTMTWASYSGTGITTDAVISADGKVVAYTSASTNLVPGDTNNRTDIFAVNLEANVIERISLSNAGVEGNGNSTSPSISADGRYIAFQSESTNLVAGDSNGQTDVFVYDRNTDTIERVSLRQNGDQSTVSSDSPSISGDGRFVAFKGGSAMITGFSSFQSIICIRDRSDNSLAGISVPYPITPTNRFALNPAISSDGNYVAFEFNTSWSGDGPTFSHTEIYLYDVANRAVQRVSGTKNGLPAHNNRSQLPSISADGRHVVFQSNMDSLDFYDTNATWDIFHYDRVTGITRRVSAPDDGSDEFSKDSLQAAISGDGQHVAFQSDRTLLVQNDTNGIRDVFVKNLNTGAISLRSQGADGADSNGESSSPSLSHDGQKVAFATNADNLIVAGASPGGGAFISSDFSAFYNWISDLTQITSNLGPITPHLLPWERTLVASVPAETSIAIFAPIAAYPNCAIRTRIGSAAFSPLPEDGIARHALNFGINVIQIEVTASDGALIGTYNLTVDRGTPDLTLTDATLTSLVASTGTLDPIFAPSAAEFILPVSNATTSLTFTPTAAQDDATIAINGTAISSGATSAPIALEEGLNYVLVEVTAPDGVTKFGYNITVKRSLGANSQLASLTLNSGSLAPVFAPAQTSYDVNVAGDVSELVLTPIAALPAATITINGAALIADALSTYPLEIGYNFFTIAVITGTTTTYNLTVTRPDPSGAVVRFDATDLLQEADTIVAGWGGQLSQESPTLLANQTPNGKPAVHFDDADRMGDNVEVPASAAEDFIIVAVIKPDNTGFYHNIVEDDDQIRPMLWVRNTFQYEMNWGVGGNSAAGNGTDGWDIVIADSRLNQVYVNSPIPNANGNHATAYATSRAFDFFHRDNAQTFRGKVAEFRIYNDRAAFGGDFAALYSELRNKWIGNPYQLWAADNIPGGQDATFLGDANNNGIANGIEYTLGTTPIVVSANGVISAPAVIPSDVDLILQRSITLAPTDWLDIASWLNGAPPVFAPGVSKPGASIIDTFANPNVFYRYEVILRE